MSQIEILLNGEKKQLARAMTIAELVYQLDLDVKKIAIEKDLEVVALDKFQETLIENGSRIEIVHFIGGG